MLDIVVVVVGFRYRLAAENNKFAVETSFLLC